jgi:hypothetical protein
VLDVSCVEGGCRVTRCAAGYSLSLLGDGCVIGLSSHTGLGVGVNAHAATLVKGSTEHINAALHAGVKLDTSAIGYVGSNLHSVPTVVKSQGVPRDHVNIATASDVDAFISTGKLVAGLATSGSVTLAAAVHDSTDTSASIKTTVDADLKSAADLDASATISGSTAPDSNLKLTEDVLNAAYVSGKSDLHSNLKFITGLDASANANLGAAKHNATALASSVKTTADAELKVAGKVVADAASTVNDGLHSVAEMDAVNHVVVDSEALAHSHINLQRDLLKLVETGHAGVSAGGELLRGQRLGLVGGLVEKLRLGARWIRNSDWAHRGTAMEHPAGASVSGARLSRMVRSI